jgi:NTE family protein
MGSMSATKTAFVLAGGGSLGAVQVGMLKALTRQGMIPDFVVGASVGALNGATSPHNRTTQA